MQSFPRSFATATFLCLFHTATCLAVPKSPDVEVCVRIEEKTWARDGTAPREPASTEPKARTTDAPHENQIAFAGATAADPSSDGAAESEGGGAPAAPPVGAPLPDDATSGGPPGRAPSATRLADPASADYSTIDPILYLKRLIEYHVTHEPGFESVDTGCSETLVVELYAVKHGWTAFARYSGNNREEKVDVVRVDELGVFAERVTTALLRDKSIAQTLTRTTVLRADSDEHVRQVKVRTHFLLARLAPVNRARWRTLSGCSRSRPCCSRVSSSRRPPRVKSGRAYRSRSAAATPTRSGASWRARWRDTRAIE